MTSKADEIAVKKDSDIVEYVVVAECEEGERIELPLSPEDDSLGLSTLVHAFPGAHGLKYKNPVTETSRALLMDQSGLRFLPPSDGWTDKIFFVIYPSRNTSDQNTKRKMMDECETEGGQVDLQGGAKQKRLDEPTEKTCTDLIVLGVPFKTSRETLKAYFENFGEVVMFDLKTDTAGNSKGFGFVRMKDHDAQLRILGTQLHEIDGRRCQVKIPLSKGETNTSVVSRIFVGRVPEKLTAEELKTFFSDEAAKIDPTAAVTDVFIPRPFRSFAFVNFSSSTVAREIIRNGDYLISGYSVAVSAAAPREPEFSPRVAQKIAFGRSRNSPMYSRKLTSQSYDTFPSEIQGGYFDNYESSDNWRGVTYRAAENRAGNRYTPGYMNSPRYSSSSRPTSQTLASGLDALKINVNPEIMDAAWQAFWNTLNTGGGSTGAGASSSGSNSAKW